PGRSSPSAPGSPRGPGGRAHRAARRSPHPDRGSRRRSDPRRGARAPATTQAADSWARAPPAHATGPRPELWVRSPALLLANAAEEGLRVRSIQPLEAALLPAGPLDQVLLQLGAVPEQRRQVPFEDLRQIQQRIELTELLLHVPRHDRRLAQGSALGQLFEGRELV